MPVLPISRMGSDILKRRADEVLDAKAPAVASLVNDMIETMIEAKGVGLAAPQVGVGQRVVIFFVPAGRNADVEVPLTVMVNPVIEPLTGVQDEQFEACLSVPNLTGKVPRWTNIRYSFTDLTGQKIVREADDFHARVVQHECDHLDGLLYPQRMKDMRTLAFVDVLQAEAIAKGKKVEVDEEGVPLE
ncbi:MAG: peptide deformylase [Rhodospirillaceae bacterium]